MAGLPFSGPRTSIVSRMKRAVVGGTHRGPVGVERQRRTIRFVQLLLVGVAAALFMYAGYSFGRAAGFDAAQRADDLATPRRPSALQTAVLAILGGGSLFAAFRLQGSGVTVPTPARLDELAGRAESAAIERAEAAAGEGAGVPERR